MPFIRYGVALICLNGHKINGDADHASQYNTPFCVKCGAKTIRQCQSCKHVIRGLSVYQNFVQGPLDFTTPSFCHECGKPHPWTESRHKALEEAVDLLDDIHGEEKEKVKSGIPDLLQETPNTQPAIYRMKALLGKATQAGREMVNEVLKQVAIEAVKKQIGL